jgi:hypothetical protein
MTGALPAGRLLPAAIAPGDRSDKEIDMKARTFLIAIGAALALVVVAVQPAGAKIASTCAASQKQSAVVGYTGSGWSYPGLTARGLATVSAKSCGAAKKAAGKASAKKVLDVGNGTKAPHLVTVPKKKEVHGKPPAPSPTVLPVDVISVPSQQPSTSSCSLSQASDDGYIVIGVQGCDASTATATSDDGSSAASTDDGSSTASADDGSTAITPVDGSYDDTDG